MNIRRPTFLSHFIICLGCGGLAVFAWTYGVPQMIWASDMSMMTSVISALFVGSAVYLGWQAWLVDDAVRHEGVKGRDGLWVGIRQIDLTPESNYGHLAERLCVMAGFVGTAIGLSLQAKSLAGGATGFTALATSLFTTASGGTAAALIAIMTFNLETGVRRAQR